MKTAPTSASVDQLVDSIDDPSLRDDCRTVVSLMQAVTGAAPTVWGDRLIGFGSYHYKYASGREGDWFVAGLAPRKNDLSIYIVAGFEHNADLLSRLGKHRTGKSCLYVKRLEDIDLDVLRDLVQASVEQITNTYGRTS